MSEQPTAVPLPSRALMRLSGEDARSFLNGVVTNNADQATAEQAIWSGFLTPQGKFLHEFFLVEGPDRNFYCTFARVVDCASLYVTHGGEAR